MSMTFENINTDWFDPNALRLPPYKVGRVNFDKGRSYIKINQDGTLAEPFRLFTSLTTAISQSMPTPIQLEEWKFKHGKVESERLTKVAAFYGTLLHIEIGRFLTEKVYDLDSVDKHIENYLSDNNFWDNDCKLWPIKLKEDMLAFMTFFYEMEVVPLGIEFVLLSEHGFGTLIDLVCLITVEENGLDYENPYKSGPRKGEPRECKVKTQKRAIINFKSGRKGFFETHGIQIECEKQLWEENFPDMPIDLAYNWAPSDWKTTPGYKLKEWSDVVSKEEVTAILKLAEIRYQQRAEKRRYLNIGGVVSSAESLQSAITFEDVEEFCHRKFGSTPTATPEQMEQKARVFTSNPLPI